MELLHPRYSEQDVYQDVPLTSTSGRNIVFRRAGNGFDRLEPTTMRLERAYDQASASSHESAWERFVQECERSAADLPIREILWLTEQIRCGVDLPYRRAIALLRLAASVAASQGEMSTHFVRAFTTMLEHRAAEVRASALEAITEVSISEAKRRATWLLRDPHPHVQESAKAVLAMKE